MSKDKGADQDHPQQYLANERTFLAWIRTSISLIGLGFIIAKFSLFIAEFKIIIQNAVDSNAVNTSLPPSKTMTDYMSILGTGMVLLAIVLIVFALKNYIQTDKAIKTGSYQSNSILLYMISIVLIILSVMTIIYLSFTT